MFPLLLAFVFIGNKKIFINFLKLLLIFQFLQIFNIFTTAYALSFSSEDLSNFNEKILFEFGDISKISSNIKRASFKDLEGNFNNLDGEIVYEKFGSSIKFEKFESFFNPETEKIHLKNLKLNPTSFSESLRGLSKLKELKLENVQLVNSSINFERIYLPSLKVFSFTHVVIPHSDIEDKMIGSHDFLKSILFFEPYKDSEWNLENIWDLNIDITIKFGEYTILEINHSVNEFKSGMKDPNEILKNLENSKVKRLTLTGISHESSTFVEAIYIPLDLTYLNLQSVKINLDELEKILSSSTDMIEILLRDIRPNSSKIDISKMPITLKKVSLIQINFDFKSLRKFDLDSLILFGIETTDYFYPNFHLVFNAKNVGLSEKFHQLSTNNSYALLNSILKTEVENIFIQNFNRITPDETETNKNITEIEHLLKIQNISELAINFHLKRIGLRSNQKNTSWVGREIHEGESEYVLMNGFGNKYNPDFQIISTDFIRKQITELGLIGYSFLKGINLKTMLEVASKATVGSLHFNNLDIYAPTFSSLIQDFYNLRFLIMENVRTFGNFSNSISLPNLRQFSFSKYRPIDTILKFNPDEEFSLDFMRKLLFLKDFNGDDSQFFTKIWDAKINILFGSGRQKYFELDFLNGQFTSRLTFTNDILKYYSGHFAAFAFKDCKIDSSLIPRNIRYLNYDNVIFEDDEELRKSLKESSFLEELYLFPEFKFDFDKKANLLVSSVPDSLKKLYLRNVQISPTLRFKMHTVIMEDCVFPSNFQTFVQNLEVSRIALLGLGYPFLNVNKDFLDLLLANTSLDWIYIDKMKWDDFSTSAKNILVKLGINLEEENEIMNDLLLERNNGSWKARHINAIEKESIVENLMDLKRFSF